MDVTMLRLIAFLNDLAHDSLNGFEEVSDWNKMEPDKVLFDALTEGESSDSYALMVVDSFGMREPENANNLFPGVKFSVVELSTGKAVSVRLGEGDCILVNNGRWYFA